ncbi:MAG: putative sulfate exporter family transporter [Herminiimonas sp.]|nr:putative sulfate exporter family transporter [Herminiimonas sp.]
MSTRSSRSHGLEDDACLGHGSSKLPRLFNGFLRQQFDTLLLAMAMAALGLSTHVSAIRRAGPKPLILATFLFCWLVAGGAAINRLVMFLMG